MEKRLLDKFEKSISDLENMISVGGTLEEADEVLKTLKEVYDVASGKIQN